MHTALRPSHPQEWPPGQALHFSFDGWAARWSQPVGRGFA